MKANPYATPTGATTASVPAKRLRIFPAIVGVFGIILAFGLDRFVSKSAVIFEDTTSTSASLSVISSLNGHLPAAVAILLSTAAFAVMFLRKCFHQSMALLVIFLLLLALAAITSVVIFENLTEQINRLSS